jgi:hypothetical protein
MPQEALMPETPEEKKLREALAKAARSVKPGKQADRAIRQKIAGKKRKGKGGK